jgi:hypothetical protein
MNCNPMIPATCLVAAGGQAASTAVDGAVGSAVGVASDGFAAAIRSGSVWVVKTTIAWWIDVPAIDLNTSPVATIRGYVQWIAVLVAVAGVIWQGTLMAISRRPEPVLAVGRGLFQFALWTAIGVAGPAAALRAGDAFSSWVLSKAAGGQAADRLSALAGLSSVGVAGAVIVLGLVMMLVGLVQAVLMLFREGAIIILSGVVVLAAAGQLVGATRPWLPRVLGWMLALICYKPAAALVYASALALIGDSTDPRTAFVGITMMLLAIIALPTLMKLFTWATGAVASSGGGLAALAGASAAGLHAAAAMSSTSSDHHSRRQHEDTLRRDLGSGPGTGSGPGPGSRPSGGPSGGGPGGGGAGSGASPSPSDADGSPGGTAPGPSVAARSGATGSTAGTAATGSTAAAGSAAGAAGSAAAAGAAGAAAPWLLAAQKLAEAARAAKDAAADATTPQDGS